MDNKKAIEVLDTVSLFDLTEPPYNEGLLPEDMDMPEAVYTYICIGGGYLGGA